MTIVVPLQLGVRDVAGPTLRSVSFWPTATGAALLVNISLVVGGVLTAPAGRLSPPLAELTYSPGVGVDYYLWRVADFRCRGTPLTGVNFVTTILNIHAPGTTYMRMPVFCWTALATNPFSASRRRIPGPDRHARACSRSTATPRLPLLHQRSRRQHDDVHEPHLDLGPSRGLHPRPAGVRRVLGSGVDLLTQTAVRLPLDGHGDHGDLLDLVHRCGCTTSSPWAQAPTSTRSSASRQ